MMTMMSLMRMTATHLQGKPAEFGHVQRFLFVQHAALGASSGSSLEHLAQNSCCGIVALSVRCHF